jgi:hypothetical protein
MALSLCEPPSFSTVPVTEEGDITRSNAFLLPLSVRAELPRWW